MAAEGAPPEPSAETVMLIYDEVETQLDKQFEQIEVLNARAQQLLGFAAGVFALIIALRPPTKDTLVTVLFLLALVLFVAIAVAGYLAWSIQGWRLDPEPERLWQRYRLWPEAWLRQQIILNWIESGEKNQASIDAKLFYLRATQVLLGLEVSYLVVILILRPYIE